MKAHALARALLSCPDLEVSISIDPNTKHPFERIFSDSVIGVDYVHGVTILCEGCYNNEDKEPEAQGE